ncbi:hemolysin family protein [Tunturibacter empetritectus]|uniref:CBS domain containing-hemolysin-like protein n=1 Tax=Tunturiibacter lichenicola TaxID=2051959 RepID=A0A7W8N5I7_9BACT|nr:hemolysin family protein [Edaphobacter lichenicola]MBB5345603.1 CBS domain containing-hemolysin-like protein [Edaphobacter lichenicola]
MTPAYFYSLALILLLGILALAAYVDRVYSEMGKFLAREYQDNIDAWERVVEPRLRLGRESIALSASVLRQLTLAALALLSGLRLYTHTSLVPTLARTPTLGEVLRAVFELILLILIFDRLLPQLLFSRTRGLWIARILPLLQTLFYLILPVTMLLQLLLSIAALAEPEDATEEDHPSEAMDALLEAGEEEGILEESDRELVRSAVEFGDKVVLEVMTPRPEIFAVPGTLTLQEFTATINEHAFSRVPVYNGSLDHVTGIGFAHDLLKVLDAEANTRTVAQIQRPAAFVPETKKVAELLREMQREKQHMRIVIDEYGSVAGLVTIEDLLEAIVGNIADEHDEPEADDEPIRESNGAYVVSGAFELSRLRDLFADQFEPNQRVTRPAEDGELHEPEELAVESGEGGEVADLRDTRDDPTALRLPEHYESTTLGGLVSEIAGHIPLPGEVVEEDGLRLEVLASTDRRIDRIRVSLTNPPDLS